MNHVIKLEGCGLLTLLVPVLLTSTALAQTAAQGAATDGADQAHSGATLEEIVISADRKNSFGADYVQVGGFRNARAIDTPLTVSVLTKDLLDAQQALSITDATRNTAGVTSAQINSVIYSNLAIRGVPADNTTNYRMNGILPVINFVDLPLEDKDRIEVLKGAAGLYYGFATPAGIVNMVTKRPAEEPITAFDVFGNDWGSIGGSFDVSRRWGDSGVRINGAASSLETGIDKTDGDRRFVSLAYDWRPTERFLLELDGEYIYKTITEPTEFALPAPVNGVIPLPPLQDPTKNLGASWMQARGWEYNVLAHARYNFSPAWSASVSAGRSFLSRERRYSSFSGYNLVTGEGTVGVAMTAGNDYDSVLYRGDVAGAVETGPIDHEILLGVSDNIRRSYIPNAVRVKFAQNLYDPVDIPEQPTPPVIVPNPDVVKDVGYFVSDRASFHDWLQLTVGFRKTDYRDISNTSSYKADPNAFSYGLMVKPEKWLSVYGTYIEGLESGGIAQQIAVNAGQVLPAAISKQREAGIKVEPLSGLLVTTAYFSIDRVSAYLHSNGYYLEDGRARYEGVELSATGELTPDLSVAVSAIYLDAFQKSGAAAIVGNRIENTARFTGSIFLEYRVPLLPGFRVSGGVFRTGDRAVNAANNAVAPGYTTFDLGGSYVADLWGHNTTFRVNGENISGVRYWAATGSSLLAEGLPRVVKFSISTAF